MLFLLLLSFVCHMNRSNQSLIDFYDTVLTCPSILLFFENSFRLWTWNAGKEKVGQSDILLSREKQRHCAIAGFFWGGGLFPSRIPWSRQWAGGWWYSPVVTLWAIGLSPKNARSQSPLSWNNAWAGEDGGSVWVVALTRRLMLDSIQPTTPEFQQCESYPPAPDSPLQRWEMLNL